MFCLEAPRNVSLWPDVDHSGTRVVFADLVHAEGLDITTPMMFQGGSLRAAFFAANVVAMLFD